jgi:hypothetical protein
MTQPKKSDRPRPSPWEVKMRFDPDKVESALRKSWSLANARRRSVDNAAAGWCKRYAATYMLPLII